MTRLHHLAPAGAPIRAIDLLRWASTAALGGDVAVRLREVFQTRFGVRHSFLTATGRAGLTLLLRSMRRLAPADRTEVVLPSYTCFSVAASVVKAGLRPRIVDVSVETLDYAAAELERADYRRVLAIVATNLYGLPNDLPALAATAKRHGVFLIDDSAQAMGASVGGRLSGTYGDAGLFSFDKGKNVSAIDGGVVVTNSDAVAAAFEVETRGLVRPSFTESGLGVVKAVAYSLLLRPSLYWIPSSLPQLELGKTVYTTAFPLEQASRALTALGLTMVARLDHFTEIRKKNARALIDGLRGLQGLRTFSPTPESDPVYLRLPLLCDDPVARARLLEVTRAAGIGSTESYPSSLADVPELRGLLAGDDGAHADAGRYVAARILTLPTHPFVTPGDVLQVITAIAGECRQPGASAAVTT